MADITQQLRISMSVCVTISADSQSATNCRALELFIIHLQKCQLNWHGKSQRAHQHRHHHHYHHHCMSRRMISEIKQSRKMFKKLLQFFLRAIKSVLVIVFLLLLHSRNDVTLLIKFNNCLECVSLLHTTHCAYAPL